MKKHPCNLPVPQYPGGKNDEIQKKMPAQGELGGVF
jgi:hypothetical protein